MPVKFAEALILSGGLQIVLSESEERTHLRDVLESPPAAGATILAVGPEGGWTIEELEQFSQSGWISASLGSTILRAETAAIAATAIVIAAGQ